MSSQLDAVTIFPRHDGDVYAVCIYNNFILTGGHDKIIRIWDCTDYKLISKINAHDHMIRCICIGEDQGVVYIISGSWDTTLKFFEFGNFSHIYTMDQHHSRLRCVVSISNYNELSIGPVCISGADDGSIICTSIASKSVLYKVKPHARFVLCLDYLLNSNALFVSGSGDMNLIFQTVKMGKIIKSINVGKCISSVLFVPFKNDNRNFEHDILCCGTSDSYVIVFDVETTEIVYTLHGNNIACICLHSSLVKVRDKIVIFVYSIFKDGTMNCWNLDSGLSTFAEYYWNEKLLGTNLLSVIHDKIGPRNIEYQLNSIVNCSKLFETGIYYACGTEGLIFCVRYNFSTKISSIVSTKLPEEYKLLHKKYPEIIVVPSLLKKTYSKQENANNDRSKIMIKVASSPKTVDGTPSSSLTMSKHKKIGSQINATVAPNIVLAQDGNKNVDVLLNPLLSQVKKQFDQTLITHNQSHLRHTRMPSRNSKFLLNSITMDPSQLIHQSNVDNTLGKSKSMNLFEKSRGGIVDINDLQLTNTYGSNVINYKK